MVNACPPTILKSLLETDLGRGVVTTVDGHPPVVPSGVI